MVQHRAELGVYSLIKQVFKLTGLAITLFTLDVENIHHQPLCQTMPSDGLFTLLPALLTEIQHPMPNLDQRMGGQLPAGRIISGELHPGWIKKGSPFLFNDNPHSFKDLFRVLG